MLPFTTYNIPESPEKKTPASAKWLWVFVGAPLSIPEEELLNKICTALKADFSEDVSMISMEDLYNSTLTFPPGIDPKLIISFGVPPSALGLWIDLQVPGIRFLESFVFVLAPSLDELLRSPLAKKQLWNSMQLFLDEK
jgi:hypothetical protein